MDTSDSSNTGFFKYVFNFDDTTKSELLNIMQFASLSLIPIVILNKAMQKYVPEADDQKGSLEILAEIIIQTFILFLGIFFIHRLVTYLPTWSGAKYPDTNIIQIIIIALVILLSLQTKLGEKVSILCDRIGELWDGKVNKKQTAKSKSNSNSNTEKMVQPISQSQNSQQMAITQSLYNQPKLPDYNSTYVNANDASALIGNTSPGMESMSNMQMPQQQGGGGGFQEPMAANEALGGSAFGANF
uniref:Uncharacterized protein n=1 Tax=viral metagenome TaxID=1070528 RepID=A0A6C0LH41_9ZZZZ